MIINNDTDEVWSCHLDPSSQRMYYHNESSNETSWVSPIPSPAPAPPTQPALSIKAADTTATAVVASTTPGIYVESTQVVDTSFKSILKPLATEKTQQKNKRRVGFTLPDGEVYIRTPRDDDNITTIEAEEEDMKISTLVSSNATALITPVVAQP